MLLETTVFQYQKGAIKTDDLFAQNITLNSFQYQKGAIKTPEIESEPAIASIPFNTKKVRLKRSFCGLGRGAFGLSIPKRCD